jgi:hypothetical protein
MFLCVFVSNPVPSNPLTLSSLVSLALVQKDVGLDDIWFFNPKFLQQHFNNS